MQFKKKHFHLHSEGQYDHNARSTTATKRIYGTSFPVFQFSSVVFPGDMISYPDELPTTTKSSNSTKVYSLPL